MVGVPGKSTGCSTCRRRKIKCDGGRPTCVKCAKSAIKCEGYERFPVFINRNKHGLAKRTRLEEVKPSVALELATFASPNTEATGLISWFWNSFARPPPSRYALLSSGHWVDCFLTQYLEFPALQSSLLAVATVRLSKALVRHDILTEARRQYARSLKLTKEAIRNESEALRDEVLATTCVMVLYELFDPTAESLHGWIQHMSGLARLIEWRGPEMHAHPAAHAIFEHTRYLLMLKHLLARQGSVLSRQEWLEKPWRQQKKSIEQHVFDEGLKLASIFEKCDLALASTIDGPNCSQLLEECVSIYETLRKILEYHINPVLDKEVRVDRAPVYTPTTELLSITAWAIQLGASHSAFSLMSCTHDSFFTDRQLPMSVQNEIRGIIDSRRTLALQILERTHACLEAPLGGMGAARMIMALRLASQQFGAAEPEYEQCQSMFEQLSGKTSKFSYILGSDNSAVVKTKAILVQDNANHIARQWEEYTRSRVLEKA